MRTTHRRLKWALALFAVALLPIGMTIAVVGAFAEGTPAPPVPKVVASWASGPMEARVAFDRAVDPAVAARLVGHVVRFGSTEAPSNGEGRPGGDGGSIRVAAARLIDEGRTLVLVTDPHPREATYSVTIDEIKPPGEPGSGRSRVVSYSLAGVEAAWTPDGGDKPAWSGWWPEVDPSVVRSSLAGSSEHDKLWPMLKQPGKLALRSFVALPAGPTTSSLSANVPFEATLGSASAQPGADRRATLKAESTGESTELTVTIPTLADGPDPSFRWVVAPANAPSDAAQAPPRSAYGVSWAPPPLPGAPATVIPPTLASGGDPARGAIVFAGEQAKCANCHQVRGQGGQVGPDLSNLSKTSRAWIYQNIMEPSASIHPDFMSYTVALKDGRVSMGIVRAEGAEALRVGDTNANFTTFPRAEVEEIRPSGSSIMPVGLLGALGDDRTRDLLAFLTSPNTPPAPGTSRPAR